MNKVFVYASKILIDKPKGDIGRHRLRWEDKAEINVKETG
jgi:hypothetical protein